MDGTPFAGSQLDDWAGMLMIPGLMRGLSLTCLSLSNNDQLGPNITITTSYYPVPAISNECNLYLKQGLNLGARGPSHMRYLVVDLGQAPVSNTAHDTIHTDPRHRPSTRRRH